MVVQSQELILEPYISIIIVTYNQEKTIFQAIESVLAQKCSFPFEVIIGEDCSIDSTRTVCIEYQKKYPNKISLILQEINKGVLINYIDTISLSRGKYIAQCAGDDFWHNPDKLQLQVEFLESRLNYGLVHTDFDELDGKTGMISKNVNKSNKKDIPEGNILKELFFQYSITAATICFRRELFFKHVPYNDFIERKFMMEDIPTFVIMSKYCKVGYLNISTATYRKGHFSISTQDDIMKTERFYDGLLDVNRYLCELLHEELTFNVKDQFIHKNKGLLSQAFKLNNFNVAKKYGKLLQEAGVKEKKILISRYYLFFKLFVFLKRISTKLK